MMRWFFRMWCRLGSHDWRRLASRRGLVPQEFRDCGHCGVWQFLHPDGQWITMSGPLPIEILRPEDDRWTELGENLADLLRLGIKAKMEGVKRE